MKSTANIFMQAIRLVSALIFIAPVSVSAGDISARTGDRGVLSIVIAAAAFIITAIITTKLTKRKNK